MKDRLTWIRNKVVWVVVMAVLITAWIAGSSRVMDKALGAPAPAPSQSQTHDFQERADPNAERKKKWVRNQVARFRSGATGNSRGYELPPRIQRMIRAKMVKSIPGAAREDTDWWKYPVEASMCLFWKSGNDRCYSQVSSARSRKRQLASLMRHTVKVAVVCGGAAIIGSVRRSGVPNFWGAGAGAGACLWSRYISRIW